MTNTNLRRGNKWAADICRSLVNAGFLYAEPRKAGAEHDTGDVAGIPGLVIEAKRHKRFELAAWLDQAAEEAINVGRNPLAVVWAHRPGKSKPEDGYVVMSGETFARLLGEAGYR